MVQQGYVSDMPAWLELVLKLEKEAKGARLTGFS
jgi:hypothetical protein